MVATMRMRDGDAAEANENAASRVVHYEGLSWKKIEDETSKEISSMSAQSAVTPATYRVVRNAEGEWLAEHGFPMSKGSPMASLGEHASIDMALTACERHDFRYWKSAAEACGLKAVFHGSPDIVRKVALALDESERDEVLDALLGEDGKFVAPSFDARASRFRAEKAGVKQEKSGAYVVSLRIEADDLPISLMSAPLGSVLDAAVVVTESNQDEIRERSKKAFIRSLVLPADPAFQEWMSTRYDRWGLIRKATLKSSREVEIATAETLRRIIGCPSRSHIPGNVEAISRIEKIDREFYRDMCSIAALRGR